MAEQSNDQWFQKFNAEFNRRVGGDYEDITGFTKLDAINMYSNLDPEEAVLSVIESDNLDDITIGW